MNAEHTAAASAGEERGAGARCIRSMTGFGRAQRVEACGTRTVVQIRSVNHKGLKLHVRLPDGLEPLRQQIERSIKREIDRGAVQVDIVYHAPSRAARYVVDRALLKRYVSELTAVQAQLGGEAQPIAIDRLAALPGVVEVCEAELDPASAQALEAQVQPVVGEALAALCAMREAEGRALAEDLRAIVRRIERQVAHLRAALPAAVAASNERLRRRVQALLGELALDGAALAREAAIAADKADVSEELTRLEAHLEAVRLALARGGPCGRRLEFLAQELQREASTLAAKLQDARLVQLALEVKLEVGRMREQAANVE